MNKFLKKNKIRNTLIKINAIKESNIRLFNKGTRDNIEVEVWTDIVSNVIFIDNFYVGNSEYMSGNYRKNLSKNSSNNYNYQDIVDSIRRFSNLNEYFIDKSICDFGCGSGTFIKMCKNISSSVAAVELQNDFLISLNKNGIECYKSLDEITKEFDTITLFHSLEHLPDPLNTLKKLLHLLKKGGEGKIIIEVPNARDFLIQNLKSKSFTNFTLWSQHLILHTNESLKLLLQHAGFKNISIYGYQRFSISNHFNWLINGTPGGNNSIYSSIETFELKHFYQEALSRINATDTLIAIAST